MNVIPIKEGGHRLDDGLGLGRDLGIHRAGDHDPLSVDAVLLRDVIHDVEVPDPGDPGVPVTGHLTAHIVVAVGPRNGGILRR